jgi:hypothetical protein
MRLLRALWAGSFVLLLTGALFAGPLCRERGSRFEVPEPFLIGDGPSTLIDPAIPYSTASYHLKFLNDSMTPSARRSDKTGIREVMPKGMQERFAKWKDQLLSTEFGRQQWDFYANNKNFLLTIVVSPDKKFGAGTDDYEWNDEGELVAATITLGRELDKGYPDPIYYPVMNSLSSYNEPYQISGNILASTKMAHEIGHVVFTAKMNSKLFQKQNKLMTSYYKIFLNNGYNTSDPRLVDLASQLGGNPIDIWEDREYWSEVNAMQYLAEKINKEYFYCSVFSRILRNINNYAKSYQDRFEQVAVASLPPDCHN